MPGQTHPKTPARVEKVANTVPVPTINSPTKENTEELMIYIESVNEGLHTEDEKEDVVERMDVEYSQDERLL